MLSWVAEGATLPAAFTRALSRGRSTRPARRQPDARTWLREVEDALAPPAPAIEAPQPAPHAVPPRRRGMITAITAAVAIAAGFVIGIWVGGDPPTPSVVPGASISISGPDEISVGERAVFTATVSGVESWSWSLPNHRFIADEADVTITPTSPGTGEIVLRSRTDDGDDLEARRTVRVVD